MKRLRRFVEMLTHQASSLPWPGRASAEWHTRVATGRRPALWVLGLSLLSAASLSAREEKPPGVVIDHSPASSGLYIGSPSLTVLTNGDYLASHDLFGPNSKEFERPVTLVFRSADRGVSWGMAARIEGAFWQNLFVHRGIAYLMGPEKHHGRIVIRRSSDGGRSWTEPRDAASGLLTPSGEYHTAPMPVIEHHGRLWRAFENASGGAEWGKRYSAGMLSIPVEADLLQATNWTFSNFLPRDASWLDGQFGAWLEGNAVLSRDGQVLDILRVDIPACPERAAIVNISADGKTASFDPATGFVEFPGGAKKFTIRFDPVSDKYWSLASVVLERHQKARKPAGIRNALALTCSRDLRSWETRCLLLYHPDVVKHGFQYVDWQFEGEDLIAACRTAYDDGQGGAHNNHDANFLTFHRFGRFRQLSMADSVPVKELPEQRQEEGRRVAAPFTNSVGLKMVPIAPGSFLMGSSTGDIDERPVHRVVLTQPFYMAATEVSNAQYEQYKPEHRRWRGARGLSREANEAVVFVSWNEASAFCVWLSAREGKKYRLPTEAEWEYACRAGTSTPFSFGEELPAACQRSQKFSWDPVPVLLAVGQTPPNSWGLYDMHGNVEEWCHDWYGPYGEGDRTDPVGYAGGLMRVSRGGSHNTEVQYLRSANRLGTLPKDKHWLIGFRVVQADVLTTPPLRPPPLPLWARDVKSDKSDWSDRPNTREPRFDPPIPFVRPPPQPEQVPFFPHNHCPSITWCDNGDLLAVWFSTRDEAGREMTILASRLRRGSQQWDVPSEFFKAPDRNMTGSALLNDGKGKLYHFNGLEAGNGWANLALVMRTSTNNGARWSRPRLIAPEHQPHNQVISGTLLTREGHFIQACDAVHGGQGGTAIHVSRDGGLTWIDPSAGRRAPDFQADESGSLIAGIHAGVVQRLDGCLLAYGRGDNRKAADGKSDRMPQSLSDDLGANWRYAASPWPPVGSGQRLILCRLREGPLLFVSFTDSSKKTVPSGLEFTNSVGKTYVGYGLFAALSFDDGRSWPVRKLITDGKPPHRFDGGAWTREFTMDETHAEPKGYLAVTQTPDNAIHLLSSALYYHFNLAWISQPAEQSR